MSDAKNTGTTSVTMRLPEVIITKSDFIGEALSKNKTDSVIAAINLTHLIVQAQANGKKIQIVDEATNTTETIHFL
jgi:hypoxanthine phosphoribosyltransferase